MNTKSSRRNKSSNDTKDRRSGDLFYVGAKVRCIDDTGLPNYVKKMGVRKGKTFTIREIGEKNFHGKGGGLRLDGIVMHSDLSGYEQCFNRNRFIPQKALGGC